MYMYVTPYVYILVQYTIIYREIPLQSTLYHGKLSAYQYTAG